MVNKHCFTLVFLITIIPNAHSEILNVQLSKFGGPAVGISFLMSSFKMNLDFTYQYSKDEMAVFSPQGYYYNVNNKIHEIGVKTSINYNIPSNHFGIELGPHYGFTQFIANNFAKIPNSNSTITAIDSTIYFQQHELGMFLGINYYLSERIRIGIGQTAGYSFGETTSMETLMKTRIGRFGLLATKISFIFNLF